MHEDPYYSKKLLEKKCCDIDYIFRACVLVMTYVGNLIRCRLVRQRWVIILKMSNLDADLCG